MKLSADQLETRLRTLGVDYADREKQYTIKLPGEQELGRGYLKEVIESVMKHASRKGIESVLDVRVQGRSPGELVGLADELSGAYQGSKRGLFAGRQKAYERFATAVRENYPYGKAGRLVLTEKYFSDAMHLVCSYDEDDTTSHPL